MQVTYQNFPENNVYGSLLVVNSSQRWKESLYFTFYTPYGEKEETLYAGRYMADVHFKNKDCQSIQIFDFHKWDRETLEKALTLTLPPVSGGQDIKEILEEALEQKEANPDGFVFKLKKQKRAKV
jgi:hypothetical protein